ncbi:hypothetical protein, partial [Burkholderia stagnalis]
VLATGAGAAVGGEAGAFSGYNVDRFNRQLHPEEKQVIKDLADGDPTKQHRLEAAGCALVHCSAEYAAGTPEYNQYAALEKEGRGYVAEQAQLQNYATTFLSVGTYGGMVKTVPSNSLFQYSSQDAKADFATLQSGLSARRSGSFDYLSVQGSALGLAGAVTINLHNRNTYLSVGGSVPVVPGLSIATGMVTSNAGLPASQRGSNTDEFLSGSSIAAGGCMFGICTGFNHAIGGDTAFEIGVGAGGVTKVPAAGGDLGVGYGGKIGTIQQ